MPNREMAEEKIVAPLKKIIRVATPKDEDIELKNREKKKMHIKSVLKNCKTQIGNEADCG